jgi:hypothetical protein
MKTALFAWKVGNFGLGFAVFVDFFMLAFARGCLLFLSIEKARAGV